MDDALSRSTRLAQCHRSSQALESNLDLAAQRRALAADGEEIGIARSSLLPHVNLGARVQLLDADRPDGYRGNTSERAALATASVARNIGLALFVAGLNDSAKLLAPTLVSYMVLGSIVAMPYAIWIRRRGAREQAAVTP